MCSEEIGQLLTMGLPGPSLTPSLRDFIRSAQPGGFILFARNLATPDQTRGLIDELVSLCYRPPIITIDQEGGRVSRLRVLGEEPPCADWLRRAGDDELISRHGRLTGQLLRLCGFNLNLAPVADILLDPEAENSLLNRCYGTSADEVIHKAGLFLSAMQGEGVQGTIKHFPGYSLCSKDPHGSLPIVNRTREEMEREELKVFRAMMPASACVMIGHAVYPHLDPQRLPSSLSPAIIRDLLRQEVGCDAMVMTDDLEMGAIAREHGIGPTVRMAMEAGNDLLLFCHQLECVEFALETLRSMPAESLARPLQAMAAFKEKLQPAPVWDPARFREINAEIGELRRVTQSKL